MAKQLLFTDEARKKLLAGAEKLSHAVGITLGPTGRNVILDKSFGGPTVTKDGVTVSKEIDLPDPFENMGAKRGIDRAVEAAVKHLGTISKRLTKKEEMEQVAGISANNDPVIGKLMA